MNLHVVVAYRIALLAPFCKQMLLFISPERMVFDGLFAQIIQADFD